MPTTTGVCDVAGVRRVTGLLCGGFAEGYAARGLAFLLAAAGELRGIST